MAVTVDQIVELLTNRYLVKYADSLTAGEIAKELGTSARKVRELIDTDPNRISYVDGERSYGTNYTQGYRQVTAFEPSKWHLRHQLLNALNDLSD